MRSAHGRMLSRRPVGALHRPNGSSFGKRRPTRGIAIPGPDCRPSSITGVARRCCQRARAGSSHPDSPRSWQLAGRWSRRIADRSNRRARGSGRGAGLDRQRLERIFHAACEQGEILRRPGGADSRPPWPFAPETVSARGRPGRGRSPVRASSGPGRPRASWRVTLRARGPARWADPSLRSRRSALGRRGGAQPGAAGRVCSRRSARGKMVGRVMLRAPPLARAATWLDFIKKPAAGYTIDGNRPSAPQSFAEHRLRRADRMQHRYWHLWDADGRSPLNCSEEAGASSARGLSPSRARGLATGFR
jgi:hypothetical protein